MEVEVYAYVQAEMTEIVETARVLSETETAETAERYGKVGGG